MAILALPFKHIFFSCEALFITLNISVSLKNRILSSINKFLRTFTYSKWFGINYLASFMLSNIAGFQIFI